jgi:tetratricopeptide (TPR) repeat protein
MKKTDPDQPAYEQSPEKTGGTTNPIAYIKAARAHLRNGEQEKAYRILLHAVVDHPDDALILSYYGCLQAIVEKKYRNGIDNCRKALARYRAPDKYSAGVIYPILYLNLGRSYLVADRKKEAIECFSKGLTYDKGHRELKKELQLLGIRKRPAVPFLSRSNPINKYIGKLLRDKKHEEKARPGR